jgi:hypothetical protein
MRNWGICHYVSLTYLRGICQIPQFRTWLLFLNSKHLWGICRYVIPKHLWAAIAKQDLILVLC